MSSSRLRQLRADDAEQVAALFVAAFGEARQLDARRDRVLAARRGARATRTARARGGRPRRRLRRHLRREDEVLCVDVAAPGRWAQFFDWAEGQVHATRGLRPPASMRPHEHELAHDRRSTRLREAPRVVVHDGDRASTSCRLRRRLRRARAAHVPRRRTTTPLIAALNDAFCEDPFWHEVTPVATSASGSSVGTTSIRRCGCSPGTATTSPGSSLGYPERGGDATLGWVGTLGVRKRVAPARARRSTAAAVVPRAVRPRPAADRARRRRREPHRRAAASTNAPACTKMRASDNWTARPVSALRARCPDCRTLTAVAIGTGVPMPQLRPRVRRRARARADERGATAARRWRRRRTWRCRGRRRRWSKRRRSTPRSHATARELPARPLVLGGCCCSHVGAVRELARRHGRIGVVWIDAHGDLNTPESSPSGNAWGMPLRMLIDAGDVDPQT